MLSDFLSKEVLKELMNDDFRIHFTAFCSMKARLLDIKVLREAPFEETFVVIFLAPPDAPFSQYLYELEHQKLGSFEMFLAPVGKDERGVLFEGILNRAKDAKTGENSGKSRKPVSFRPSAKRPPARAAKKFF